MTLFSQTSKLLKAEGEKPNAVESAVSQALLDLEANSDLANALRGLYFVGAEEVVIRDDKVAVVIHIPFPQQKVYQKIQSKLVRELEKKLSGKHVIFLAKRRILSKPTRHSRNLSKQKRPRSRTLTAVHDSILDDLVFPAEITGKRKRVKLDGSQLLKVHLEKSAQINTETKVDTFMAVYKKLTGKDVVFEYVD
eukprot:sb/3470959/